MIHTKRMFWFYSDHCTSNNIIWKHFRGKP